MIIAELLSLLGVLSLFFFLWKRAKRKKLPWMEKYSLEEVRKKYPSLSGDEAKALVEKHYVTKWMKDNPNDPMTVVTANEFTFGFQVGVTTPVMEQVVIWNGMNVGGYTGGPSFILVDRATREVLTLGSGGPSLDSFEWEWRRKNLGVNEDKPGDAEHRVEFKKWKDSKKAELDDWKKRRKR